MLAERTKHSRNIFCKALPISTANKLLNRVYSSANDSLRSAKNVLFSFFCIFDNRPMEKTNAQANLLTVAGSCVETTGEVEDTRLEAEAKDTKDSKDKDSPSEDRTSRGQGQECSWPRTKNTSANVHKNKKRLPNFFSGGLQNFNNSEKSAVL